MIEEEARKQLAEQLMNLAESLIEDEEVGVLTEEGNKKELKVTAILGNSTTLIAIKFWTEEELNELRRIESEEWPDTIYE